MRSPLKLGLPLLALAAAALAIAPEDDSGLKSLPFDQWLAGGAGTPMRWAAIVSRAQLSVYQRMMSEIEVRIDGAEIAARPREGQLFVLVQVTDQQGRPYRNHFSFDLSKIKPEIAKQDVIATFSVFVLPGDYRVAAALYDTTTKEHAIKQARLDVPPLKNDPLPDAWRDLPAVEFLPPGDPPDSWYLPELPTRLHLPLKPRSPIEIELAVNLSPSEAVAPKGPVSRNLAVLIPALRIIASLDGPHLNTELLDLRRQRVAFRQESAGVLDWTAVRRSLSEAGAATIDLHSLEHRRQSAEFFVSEIGRIVRAPGPRRVLLVLSSPVAFEPGTDLHRITGGPNPDCRVLYIRYRPYEDPLAGLRGDIRRPFDPPRRRGLPQPYQATLRDDELAGTIAPLAPRIFDVSTPQDFRKALAAVMAEISNE